MKPYQALHSKMFSTTVIDCKTFQTHKFQILLHFVCTVPTRLKPMTPKVVHVYTTILNTVTCFNYPIAKRVYDEHESRCLNEISL